MEDVQEVWWPGDTFFVFLGSDHLLGSSCHCSSLSGWGRGCASGRWSFVREARGLQMAPQALSMRGPQPTSWFRAEASRWLAVRILHLHLPFLGEKTEAERRVCGAQKTVFMGLHHRVPPFWVSPLLLSFLAFSSCGDLRDGILCYSLCALISIWGVMLWLKEHVFKLRF